MPRALLLIPAALAAVTLAGCSLDDGPRATQTRDVAAFTRVESPGSVDLRLHVGRPQRVEVRAGEKVIDDVRTSVHGGTLYVTFDHDGLSVGDTVVDATVPRLTAVDADGSGDIDVDGIRAGAFALRSNGSADVSLSGTARRLAVNLNGSGDAHLAGLEATEARVSVAGSGDLDVRASDRLDVGVAGSGDVRYHGHPALTHQVDGSGDLTRAG
jgi:hypothetical protein